MRKLMILTAFAAAMFAGTMMAGKADAMTLGAPAGLAAAAGDAVTAEQVAWRCGPFGCRWVPNYYGFRPYYRPYYRPYAYRPYGFYRPYRRWY